MINIPPWASMLTSQVNVLVGEARQDSADPERVRQCMDFLRYCSNSEFNGVYRQVRDAIPMMYHPLLDEIARLREEEPEVLLLELATLAA